MPSVYRTALGKQVDIDRIRLLNEEIPAVGNMRVNARGDQLDRQGNIVQSKEDRVIRNSNTNNNKTFNAVVDEPIAESRSVPAQSRPVAAPKDNTAELLATIEQLQRELAEKNSQLSQGRTLKEAVADEPVVKITEAVEETAQVLEPTKTDNKPAKGGLAAAIQKNLELQAKKTKPKRI